MSAISIVIGTANRAKAIDCCLEHIARLVVPPDCALECIVVDNNSRDETEQVIKRRLLSLPFAGRYVFEPVQGVSRARNTGVAQAAGDIVAFTDDDCIVDPNWLVAIKELYDRDPELQFAGGRVELFDPLDMAETIKTSKENDVLDSISKLRGFLHGCNLTARKSALERLGGFDERFGAGVALRSAEDIDLVYRGYRAGMKIAYCPDFLVYHDHGRSSERAIQRLLRDYKIGQGAFYLEHLLRGRLDVLLVLCVQLRPPLRRWITGPDRLKFVRKYFWHLVACSYFAVGVYRYLKLGLAGKRA
ncbi:MAG: glycosyltransferase [Alphaproteobacteria bacterium]|nr:glycosyltransferase [Alphaproteobacteria bacterium]